MLSPVILDQPYCALILTRAFCPIFPFLLVIITTPLAAREPYIAVEEASFNTVMLSMSFGFNAVNAPDDIGEPSRIKRGSVFELIELTPRNRITTLPLGSPLGVNTCKPATCPCNASPALATGLLAILLLFTVFT